MNLLHRFVWDETVAARDGIGAVAFEHRVESIERRVLAVVIQRAMHVVGSRLDGGVDDRTAGAAHFGLRDARRDFEFGDGVRVREDADGAELRLVVIHAVEREVIIGRALAVDRQRAAARAREARSLGRALGVA